MLSPNRDLRIAATMLRIDRKIRIYRIFTLLLVFFMIAQPLPAVQPAAADADSLLNAAPFNRANWGVLITDHSGNSLFERNPDNLFIPASNLKLIVSAAASVLLGDNFTVTTSVFGTGPVENGVLQGDLVVYGRGDPTFSERCYGPDTTAAGACETMWSRTEMLADSIIAAGIRRIEGNLIGDGSYFESAMVHPAWEVYDLNWWYAAPVSALGFNDNSVNITWGPGTAVNAPAAVSFDPALGNFSFDNRARTLPEGERANIDFFRHPGSMSIWAEGGVPIDHGGRTEYFAMPDPNLYFVQALRATLEQRGVGITGSTTSTTDPNRHAYLLNSTPLVDFESKPVTDMVFPILNTSQNLFAETLLKLIGSQFGDHGSWSSGLEVTSRFLIDSIGIDSTAFLRRDGSGLAAGNLITPRAIVGLLRYMYAHPRNGAFMRGLPRAGKRGSLRNRFRGTSLAGRVVAKTGSVSRVAALSGYVEGEDSIPIFFSIIINNHPTSSRAASSRIDEFLIRTVTGMRQEEN